MTTAQTFQGLNTDNKPSSRVLNPPGGSSSNIFGASDAQPQARNTARNNSDSSSQSGSNAAGQGNNAAAAQKSRGSRNAFNPITGEPYEQAKPKPELKQSANNASVTPSKTETGSAGTLETAESLSSDTLSGQERPADNSEPTSQDEPQPAQPGSVPQPAVQSETPKLTAHQAAQQQRNQSGIFGGGPQEAQEHRSTRVSQPPGGRSTKLW